jgi:hypothetical protein
MANDHEDFQARVRCDPDWLVEVPNDEDDT